MSRQIIGLVGSIGTGKDTIADYLVKNKNFQKTSFAKRLKDITAIVFNWNRELLEGSSNKSREWREKIDPFWNITPRKALQKIGTEMFRDGLDDQIWVRSVEHEILSHPDTNFVITDCRFKNECDMIKELGGIIIYVERFQKPSWIDKVENAFNNPHSKEAQFFRNNDIHPSEWMPYHLFIEADYFVENKSSKEDLFLQVEDILSPYPEIDE